MAFDRVAREAISQKFVKSLWHTLVHTLPPRHGCCKSDAIKHHWVTRFRCGDIFNHGWLISFHEKYGADLT